MRLAGETQSAPLRFMRRDGDRTHRQITVEIFLRQHLTEFLGAETGVFAGDDIDDVLDGIGRHRLGVVGMRIGAGEIALDHRFDIELTDLVPFAVAMNPHDADPALAISVLDERHAQDLPSTYEIYRLLSPQYGPINEQRSCQASTPPVRRVTPGRDQERHMEMSLRLGHRTAQRDAIEKWR